MKNQERITKKDMNVKDFLFSFILEEFDNQIKVKILKEDILCRALFNKYIENRKELKEAIVEVCENWIEELKNSSNYHQSSGLVCTFTEKQFIWEISFSDD